MKRRVKRWSKFVPKIGTECPRARGTAVLLILLLSLFWTMPTFAQGCAMCYSTAAAASKDGQMALDRAVAVLLAPPLGFMTLGLGLAFRYGRKRDREQCRDHSPASRDFEK